MLRLSKENKRFGALQFTYFAAFCIVFSYIVTYFKSVGIDDAKIGIIVASANLVSIFVQPVFGYLSDFVVSSKKILILGTILSIIFSSLLPFTEKYFIWFFIVYMCVAFSERPLSSTIDGYITKMATKRSGLDFGVTRALGSLGFAICSLALGKLIDTFGFKPMFIIHAAILIIQTFILFTLEEYPVTKRDEKDKKKSSFISSATKLTKMPEYLILLVSSTIVFIGACGSNSFLAALVLERGGSNIFLGQMLFVTATIEIPILFFYKKISRKVSSKALIIMSFCSYIIRFVIVSVLTSLTGVFISQFFIGIAYAIFLPSSIRYVQKIVPNEMLSTAITVLVSICMGMGTVIGALAAGFMISSFGVLSVQYAAAICSAAGLAVFIIGTQKNKKTEAA